MLTDGDLPSQSFAQIRRRRQVIGVDMGLQQPVHLQSMHLDMGNERIGRGGGGAARGGIKVEHAVDDRREASGGIMDDIGDREGRLVEEGVNDRPAALAGLDLRARRCEHAVNHAIAHKINSIYRLHYLCNIYIKLASRLFWWHSLLHEGDV